MGLQGFELKLGGYGLKTTLNDHDVNGTLRTQGGTNSYLASELFESRANQTESKYDPKKGDIFALAIALF